MNSLNESEIQQNDTMEFLNVLITGGCDECSRAELNDVLNLNHLMKSSCKYYKMASIQYMSKANDALKEQLLAFAASTQKRNAKEDLGRYIPAKYSNISSKLENVIDWFDGKLLKSTKTLQGSVVDFQEDISDQLVERNLKRCVVFTVCVNDNIISSNDALSHLLSAL